jgi:hypothetical protein
LIPIPFVWIVRSRRNVQRSTDGMARCLAKSAIASDKMVGIDTGIGVESHVWIPLGLDLGQAVIIGAPELVLPIRMSI